MKLYSTHFVFTVLLCFGSVTLHAQSHTKVIAHRGYWDCEGSAQNSIFALKKAQEIGIYGSEFDVVITSDGIPVINHDDNIGGLKIEDTPFDMLRNFSIKNGEKLPTLESYLQQGKKDKRTKLILEIKPHSTKEREDKAVKIITAMVKKSGMNAQVEYISFSLNICKEIIRLQPKAITAYLKGDLSPAKAVELGLKGLDYHYNVYRINNDWIPDAKRLGLTVNVWTVNDTVIMREMIEKDVNYITTDKPLVLKQIISEISN